MIKTKNYKNAVLMQLSVYMQLHWIDGAKYFLQIGTENNIEHTKFQV